MKKFDWILGWRVINYINLLYRGKELIHYETELIIYQLKWYSSTSLSL